MTMGRRAVLSDERLMPGKEWGAVMGGWMEDDDDDDYEGMKETGKGWERDTGALVVVVVVVKERSSVLMDLRVVAERVQPHDESARLKSWPCF